MQAVHQQMSHSPLRTSSTLPRSHPFAAASHGGRSLQTYAPDPDRRHSVAPVPECYGHTFSRIQVYPTTAAPLQPKLTVNMPGDAYEREADQIADAVLRMPDPFLPRAAIAAETPFTARTIQAAAPVALTGEVPACSMGQRTMIGSSSIQPAGIARSPLRVQEPLGLPITQVAPMIQRRTLGMAGSCWFQDCQTQLQNFFMIPEDGPPGFHPSGTEAAFRVDDVDGVWYKFHTPTNEWFKIPDIGTAHVFCTEDEQAARLQPAAIVPFATAGWSDENIHTPNPYA